MDLKASFQKHTLKFKFDAATSRGLLKTKDTWFIKLWQERSPQFYGIGECGPLAGLSIDDKPDFENKLKQVCREVERIRILNLSSIYQLESLKDYPSIVFALETAMLDLINGGKRVLFKTPFIEGQKAIPINGLIWMGKKDFMMQQIREKMDQGFKCIKMKIGGIDFDDELAILADIRKKYPNPEIVIRLDANGGLKPSDAIAKLKKLSKHNIQSIEQPIAAGDPEQMAKICAESPIPVALDEELINLKTYEEKKKLLQSIKPAYIVLKPTLLGGFRSCREWIDLVQPMNIGWWITSSLESNIGLNSIAQFTSSLDTKGLHQGLGTGQLYTNNIESPMVILLGNLMYDKSKKWDLKAIS
ncbi:MAG: o-succinylbenzoate synthase [Cytophagaceae bacterium]|nr:o-succinylbenzoate synthase [Cytophagaceae bacterium]